VSMYYSHLLVPPDRNLVFDAASMTAFLEAVAKAGFVGKDAERFVKVLPTPEGAFYWGMSRDLPKTGKYRGPNPASWVRPESEEELTGSACSVTNGKIPPQNNAPASGL
jgi:hypothetical protein